MTSTLAPSIVPPDELLRDFKVARRVIVFTGAGMSAESGIPTFRDALAGLWSTFNPEALATVAGFRNDPDLVWGWYEARRHDVMRTTPNAGHLALGKMQTLDSLESLTVVTQNVDDLHERGGSINVIHLHGSLFSPRCILCGQLAETGTISEMPPAGVLNASRMTPPACAKCGSPVRPGVVWFGEELPQREWSQALKLVGNADLMLVVGTSGRVYPAARLPDTPRQRGCKVWVIDPEAPAPSHSGRHWKTTAAIGLPSLLRCLNADQL
jgi:NAD-dependent deacetylase